MDPITERLSSLSIGDTPFLGAMFGDGRMNTPIARQQYAPYISIMPRMFDIAIEALTAVEENKNECFDALVSECACQLRALKVTQMATKIAQDGSRRKALSATKERLIEVRNRFNDYKLEASANGKTKLQIRIEQDGFDCNVSEDELYFIDAYLLTITKKVKNVTSGCFSCHQQVPTTCEVTDEKAVSDQVKLAQAIIKVIKTRLAATSVAFIRQELKNEPVARLLGPENERLIQGRVEIPCFYSLTQVFVVAAREAIPVLLKVQRCAHFIDDITAPFDVSLLYVPQNRAYHIAPLDAIDPSLPIIVVEGRRSGTVARQESKEDYIARLSKYCFEDLIAMTGAQHAQYTDRNVGIPCIEVEEAQKIKHFEALAKEVGCSFNNQTLLLMSHVFSSCMKNQMRD